MPKYEVTFTEKVVREVTYTIDADHKDDAMEEAYDLRRRLFVKENSNWDYEKVYDSYNYVNEVKSAPNQTDS